MKVEVGGETQETPTRPITPIVEFRRWLLIAFVLSVCGSFAFVATFRLGTTWHQILSAAKWTVVGIAESWVMFNSASRRTIWIAATTATGAALTWLWDWQRLPFGWLIYLVPAALEFMAAAGVRKRPWVWFVVTVPLFGFASWWIPSLAAASWNLTSSIGRHFPMLPKPDYWLTHHASNLAVILGIRVVVGSFVASRKSD
jgi:hypothetical protein